MFLLEVILLFTSFSFTAAYPAEDLRSSGVKEPLLDVSKDFVKRGAVRSSKYKWLTSTEGGKTIVKIPYIVDRGLGSKAKSELERAMQDLHVATCVRFRPWTNEENHVTFKTGAGCQSEIGRRVGNQDVLLGAGCDNKGTILHELIHLLGFFHEHNREDRDTYLKIYEDNIDPGYKEAVMKKYGPDKMENLGFAYDLHSIMQYGKHAFAKSENLLTMEARSNPNMELGNHDAMSAADIMKVNKLYQCAERTDEYKDMQVTVVTGDGWWDGTDSFLYLELIGDNGKRSGESSVGKGGYYDDFESDKTDRYLVAFKDVGPIRQLKVRLQENPNGSFFDGWRFNQITITDGAKTYTFHGRDLDPNESVTVNAA